MAWGPEASSCLRPSNPLAVCPPTRMLRMMMRGQATQGAGGGGSRPRHNAGSLNRHPPSDILCSAPPVPPFLSCAAARPPARSHPPSGVWRAGRASVQRSCQPLCGAHRGYTPRCNRQDLGHQREGNPHRHPRPHADPGWPAGWLADRGVLPILYACVMHVHVGVHVCTRGEQHQHARVGPGGNNRLWQCTSEWGLLVNAA